MHRNIYSCISRMELKELQLHAYNTLKNYKIEYSSSKNNCCAIYFSSNAIFWPDTEDEFNKSIFERDRYEMTKMKIVRADKHIFVRDIFKLWYLQGINREVNNIAKLVDLIKNEVEGYNEVVVCGISGGGYIAVIVGTQVNANIILCLDGQWHLAIENDGMRKFFKESTNNDILKYENIAKSEYDNPSIFYLVSVYSKVDVKHLKEVECLKNVHIVRFVNSHHGVPFLKPALPVVLNMTYDNLCELERHRHLPIFFEIKCVGFLKIMKYLYKAFFKRIIIKM